MEIQSQTRKENAFFLDRVDLTKETPALNFRNRGI